MHVVICHALPCPSVHAVHGVCFTGHCILYVMIRAETLAAEIKELQKEMADYNTVSIAGMMYAYPRQNHT